MLPPNPKWDVTDFGLGNFDKWGLVLVNLAEEKEYCEKIMFAYKNQVTPAHAHNIKKEDIICRAGKLAVRVWFGSPKMANPPKSGILKVNGDYVSVGHGGIIYLLAGERVTLEPGIFHEFYPVSDECMIGEVSTANNDHGDNIFVNDMIGRFPEIIEDEPTYRKLVSESVHN